MQCIRRDENVEAQVEALLSKMTLKEKIGQMCELTIDKVAQSSSDGNVASNKSEESLAGGLLSGEASFSGRLPYTYPKYHGSFITYDCKPCEYVETMAGAYNYDANTPVQWPFGFGLSYSDVTVSDLKLLEKGDVLKFGVTLTNKSDRAVKEPVLLFISDLVPTLTPDIKRLRAFEKVSLEAGESKTVELSVKASDLSFVDEDLNWVLEPGEFKATVGCL